VGKRGAEQASDLDFWASTLGSLAPLAPADLDLVRPSLTTVSLPAGGVFLQAGGRASRVGLVCAGVLREAFVLSDGSERIRGFGVEGALAGSLSDLLSNAPARTGVAAELPSRLVCLPWETVLHAAATRPAWDGLLARVTRDLYLTKAEREYELLALDAEQRYLRFRDRYPGLEARVSQRSVASYLGITPEHLSRIRARQRARGKRPVPPG
jgi:CRP-like cAMP-binding protein